MAKSTYKRHRELSTDEITMLNTIIEFGNQCGNFIERLENEPFYGENDTELNIYPDSRWLAIGKTHLQTGFMCLHRAIGKSPNF